MLFRSYAFTGKNLMVNRAADSLMKGQISSLLLILFIIFVLFSVLYTSWLAGLLSLVPNIIPILLNFGLMGLLGVPLNPGTAMVAAIAIGVAVDRQMTGLDPEQRVLLHVRLVLTQMWVPDPRPRRVPTVLVDQFAFDNIYFLATWMNMTV